MKRISIIGGGPAGSASALYLLRAGVDPGDIVIYDRALFPRPKLCAGAVTYRGTQRLRELGLVCACTATSGIELNSPFGSVRLREPGPQLIYDRSVLDAQLLALCRAAGVEVREGCRVVAIEPAIGGCCVRTTIGASSTQWVIGADGALGITRLAASLRGGPSTVAIEATFKSDDDVRARDWLYFETQPLFEGLVGMAWIFPYTSSDGEPLWKVGVGGYARVPGERLRRWLRNFTAKRGLRQVAEPAGWPIHFYSLRNQAHRPGVVLVGEAHGADPLLGEGISPALEMAAFAAPRIKAALDTRNATIPAYEWRFALSEEGLNLNFQSFLARRLQGARGPEWVRRYIAGKHGRNRPSSGQTIYGRMLRRAPTFLSALLRN